MQETTVANPTIGERALPATRVLAALMAALVFTQGTLAGSFLNGTGGALGIHRTLGEAVIPWVALVTVITAIAAVRRNRWIVPVTVLAAVGTGVQIHMGFISQLDVHLPLGLALFGTYLVVALAARDRHKEKR